MNAVGTLDWLACQECKHYRPDKGGCEPLDKQGKEILKIEFAYDSVECLKFEEAKP